MEKDFPQYLYRPYRLLWFEMDEIIIMFVGYVLAMMFSLKLILLIPLAVYFARVEKRRRARGVFKHIWYRFGIMNLHGYPSYFEREFRE